MESQRGLCLGESFDVVPSLIFDLYLYPQILFYLHVGVVRTTGDTHVCENVSF